MRYPGQCPPFVFCSFCLSGAPTLLFVHCVLTYRNKKTTKGQREKKKKKKKRFTFHTAPYKYTLVILTQCIFPFIFFFFFFE